VSVHNNDFESFIRKKSSREGIEVSDGRNEQNMWIKWVCPIECCLSVHSHLLVLKYAIYAFACLDRFCRISHRSFEPLSRSDPLHLRYHPENNWGENLGFRSVWPGAVAALPLLKRNIKCRSAMWIVTKDWKKKIYIYIYLYSIGEAHGVSWRRLYTVQSLKYNRDAQLHWTQLQHFGERYTSLWLRAAFGRAHRTMILWKELPTHLTVPHRIPGQVRAWRLVCC